MLKKHIVGILVGFAAVGAYAESQSPAAPVAAINAAAHTVGTWVRGAFDFSVGVGKSFFEGVKRDPKISANSQTTSTASSAKVEEGSSLSAPVHSPERVPVEERSVYAEQPVSAQ